MPYLFFTLSVLSILFSTDIVFAAETTTNASQSSVTNGKEWREWLVAIGSIVAALVAAIGIWAVLRSSKREHSTAVDLHQAAIDRENKRITENRIALATALFTEIHSLTARCVLDGITWANKHVEDDISRRRFDTPKFRPFTSAVYLAMADRLTELPPDAAHLVIRFYNAIEVIDRQVKFLNDNPEYVTRGGRIGPNVSPDELVKVTARFHQVLQPAEECLKALRPILADSQKLERTLRDGDRQYLADKTLLASLGLEGAPMLQDTFRPRVDWFNSNEKMRPYAQQYL